MKIEILFSILIFISGINWSQSQPPMGENGGGMMMGPMTVSFAGNSKSTECTVTSGDCKEDGTSNYMDRELTYDTATGKFSGYVVSNQCANNNRWGDFGTEHFGNHQASCIKQEIPSSTFAKGPNATPLRGPIGFSLSGGVNIYGPYEAGFYLGQACTNGKGSCAAGLDVAICDAELTYECGKENLRNMLMDSCGGHASPYHYHLDLACDYDHSSPGHSQLIGLALDGYGIYGLYESTGQMPTNLDACGGHFGPVPARTINGVTYPAASNVYHYHTSLNPPFTLGCYGPVTSIEQCKSLYPDTCNTGFEEVQISDTCKIAVDTDCPCYYLNHYEKLKYDNCSEVKNYMLDSANREQVSVKDESLLNTSPTANGNLQGGFSLMLSMSHIVTVIIAMIQLF